MTAGLNKRVDIWRIDTDDDDAIGGAMVTGTLVHYNVMASLEENPANQLLEQQGLETLRTFTSIVVPGTLDIRERDELEVIKPRDDPYYGERFRINRVTFSRLNPRDPRNYMMLGLVRSVRAHDLQ